MTLEIKARRSVIVYLNNVKQAKQLRRFGVIEYISDKLKYAVIYMDEADIDKKQLLISRLGFVKSVEVSNWPEVDSTVGGNQDVVAFTVDEFELDDLVVDDEL
ncbi:YlbG family protein [Weissella coleopterorum]|uniref:YlbG family protein n=1 Tax=Weissella coleopterorum TaxID=2714949 RepID=A0A6G8B052_9LACO|nr:YlbG family protein [Weissella coleopterorum]QIL50688.1 YlbG family protein [Weissella coleopterorum]